MSSGFANSTVPEMKENSVETSVFMRTLEQAFKWRVFMRVPVRMAVRRAF